MPALVKGLLLSFLMMVSPVLTFARGENIKQHKSNAHTSHKATAKNRNVGARSGGAVYTRNGLHKDKRSGAAASRVSWVGK